MAPRLGHTAHEGPFRPRASIGSQPVAGFGVGQPSGRCQIELSDLTSFLAERRLELWRETLTHARLVALALGIAVPAATSIGIVASTRPRAAAVALGIAGVVFTIPSLALFGLFVAPLGLGSPPAVAALTLYALLPILRNTLAGLDAVAPEVVAAAEGMGMSGPQVLARVRLPLALPSIVAGIRVATVAVVGIATVAALVAGGGLGTFVFNGLNSGERAAVAVGALAVVALALTLDGVFGVLEAILRRRLRLGSRQKAGGR